MKLHPGKSFIGVDKWNEVRGCLVQHLSSAKIDCVSDLALMHILKSGDLTEGF